MDIIRIGIEWNTPHSIMRGWVCGRGDDFVHFSELFVCFMSSIG